MPKMQQRILFHFPLLQAVACRVYLFIIMFSRFCNNCLNTEKLAYIITRKEMHQFQTDSFLLHFVLLVVPFCSVRPSSHAAALVLQNTRFVCCEEGRALTCLCLDDTIFVVPRHFFFSIFFKFFLISRMFKRIHEISENIRKYWETFALFKCEG